jgi:copper transport protein
VPWLWQAPLVLLGTSAAAIGAAVARGTDGVSAGPAVVAGMRGVSYVGLVLAAGSLAFALLAWPEGLRSRRLATTVWTGWLVTVLATVAQMVVRDGSGVPLADGDRVVTALGVRLAVLLAGVVWVSAALTGRAAPRAVGLALAAVLAGTWVYAGPAAPGWITVVVTVAHISAACVWAGGLLVLAVVLLPRGSSGPLERPLSSFSRLATGCVVVLAVSGTFHGWSRAGSFGDLFTTGYGHAFWLKLAAVVAMLAVANGNRLYVLRHVETRPRSADTPPPLHLLGLFLGAEIAFGVVVMVVTGILVGAPVDG